ncbi:MAG: tetraacyldisaccharide 4'-kinase [Bryobacterales bacterium]|nr:tetraacyldisaccharide 4'-kinase [Bryobacterales bacterium]
MNWRRFCIFSFYRLLGWILLPLLFPYFFRRVLRQRDYIRNLRERFGLLPNEFRQSTHGSIWIHAVSVGEAISAAALITEMRRRYPLAPVFLSVTTVAGRRVAEQRLQGLCDGIFYTPLDYCFAIRSILRRIQPLVLVILETEIWPHLYREVKKTFAGLMIVNGRISPRAHRRYMKARWFFSEVLALPDVILTQDEASRRRFASLMRPEDLPRLSVGGNLKYDLDVSRGVPPADLKHFFEGFGKKQVWIAASTMPPMFEGDLDEDPVVIDTFRELSRSIPDLLLVLVPRHPERFELAAERLRNAGVSWVRRSELSSQPTLQLPGVMLLDSLGELPSLFPLADVVFMGGSINHRGGHNVLEPAACGKAVIIGPHMQNFPGITADFLEADALLQVERAGDLAGAVRELLLDPEKRARLGERARAQFERGKGATERAIDRAAVLYEFAVPRPPRSWWQYVLLWPLARLWQWGASWKRTRQTASAKRLPVPAVSIGNITTGGVGKTPLVLWLTERLRERGLSPAILTRGYRRASREPIIIAAPGEILPRMTTGDEPQIFLHRAGVPLGIGANRYETGLKLLERFQAGVFLLDDGFQHWRLARDFDLVLIDALMPFGERDMVPLGRLREPLANLARADAFLLTRTSGKGRLLGIEARLRAINSKAPIFRSRVVPMCWVDAANGVERPVADWRPEAVMAFCGLANPNSFRQTLRALGVETRAFWPFPDHHVYAPSGLRRLEELARNAGALALVTTEKDFYNLEQNWYMSIRQTPLYWLKIGTEVDDGDSLVNLILERTGMARQPGVASPHGE